MKTVLTLTIALFSTSALAQNLAFSLIGVDGAGQECTIQVSNQMDGSSLSIHVGGYDFNNAVLKQNEDGSSSFNETMMAHSEKVYSRLYGAPITIGNLGLLRVTGKLIARDGNIESVKLKAVGSFLNWWRETFECKNLH